MNCRLVMNNKLKSHREHFTPRINFKTMSTWNCLFYTTSINRKLFVMLTHWFHLTLYLSSDYCISIYHFWYIWFHICLFSVISFLIRLFLVLRLGSIFDFISQLNTIGIDFKVLIYTQLLSNKCVEVRLYESDLHIFWFTS